MKEWHMKSSTRLGLVLSAVLVMGFVLASCDSTANGGGGDDTTPPGDVSSLSCTAGDAEFSLTWTDPSDADLDHIEITWSPDGSSPQTVDVGTETLTATGLTNGTEYTFTVCAVDAAGNKSGGVTDQAIPTAPGTLAVALTNASAENGVLLHAYVYPEGVQDFGANRLLALNIQAIQDGQVSFVLKEHDGNWGFTSADWIGSAGGTYELLLFVDTDGDEGASSGEKANGYPSTITIHGDTTLDLDYENDLTAYDPENGTLTVSVSGLTSSDGDYLTVVVTEVDGDTSGIDETTAEIVNGAASLVVKDQVNPSEDWIGAGGSWHDVYILIDENGDGNGDNGELAVDGLEAQIIVIDSDTVLEYTADDFSEVTGL